MREVRSVGEFRGGADRYNTGRAAPLARVNPASLTLGPFGPWGLTRAPSRSRGLGKRIEGSIRFMGMKPISDDEFVGGR